MQRHYNTTHAQGQMLIDYEAQNIKGDRIVLSIFKQHPNSELTPREVHSIAENMSYKYELTSIRRSINTLTKDESLVKLGKDKQKLESKGKPNYTWKLNQK